jgi:hypothetical protein
MVKVKIKSTRQILIGGYPSRKFDCLINENSRDRQKSSEKIKMPDKTKP